MTLGGMAGNAGSLLGDRYRLLKQLGQGGFGYTYLAEDTYRFNELCVLKEFVPQVEGEAALQKAQQLFEREAGVLYQLAHPQIPKFRELLRVKTSQQWQLFLVQDYIEGPTYKELLETRLRYDSHFSETEVQQMFSQLLPVLDYIHSLGVIHRDISPDNLILRNQDGKPVLIDFGGVKQVAATVVYQLSHPGAASPHQALTRLGKVGYAPEEQISAGVVTPASDLYALGVTGLVLLTGQEPQMLYDAHHQTWNWDEDVTLSPQFAAVLRRLLAARPSDRFQSARALMQALDTPPAPSTTAATVAAAPAATNLPSFATTPVAASSRATQAYRSQPPTTHSAPPKRSSSGFLQAILGLLLLIGAITLVWWVAAQWQPIGQQADTSEVNEADNADSSSFSREEQARKQALQQRRQALGISSDYFVRLSDQVFYDRYPDLRGTTLTESAEDAPARLRWDNVASELLDLLEANLSTGARQQLGSYGQNDLGQWQSQLNQRFVSSKALYDLADAKFLDLFPGQAGRNFLEEPIGQIWYGLASDRLQTVLSGDRLDEIRFESGRYSRQVSGQLAPGEGQVYIMELTEGQLLRLSLQAPADSTALSLYLPRPSDANPYLLSDSEETTWSGRLPQSGYYEVVVVSQANRPINYRLSLSVDNVISDPEDTPADEADEAAPPTDELPEEEEEGEADEQ
ncbi:serine/threonine-protein kinase [Sphaerothrix gracilis]|uniref:serine/threonine-protein kinase n=1 Tax=Sphaerothrix gracilis TaxID=3151835 RepID=UPI0031FBF654